MYDNAISKLNGYSHWRNVPRYTKEEKIQYKKDISEYKIDMLLKEKIHICNIVLPILYEIVVRKDNEIYVFDTMDICLYGDETEYPLELIVNKIIREYYSTSL
jgi:hypothetical protein